MYTTLKAGQLVVLDREKVLREHHTETWERWSKAGTFGVVWTSSYRLNYCGEPVYWIHWFKTDRLEEVSQAYLSLAEEREGHDEN